MNELTCLEVEEEGLVGRYLAGRLGPDPAARFEAHYLTCDNCQTALQVAVALRAELRRLEPQAVATWSASSVRASTPGAQSRARRLRFWLPAGAAAAATLAGLLVWGQWTGEPAVHRRSPEGVVGPTAIQPVGQLSVVERFTWSATAGADLYRVAVYDMAGQALFEVEARDTSVMAPSGASFQAGQQYVWTVTARVGWDRWVGGEATPFTVLERR